MGQTLGAQNDKGNERGQEHFAKGEIEHGLALFVLAVVAVVGFVVGAFVEAFFEVVDGAAEVFANVTQFFGAEDEYGNDEDDQPMPAACETHDGVL